MYGIAPRVLADSGPLIALFDKSDKYHEAIKAFLRDNRCRLVTTLAVVTEVSHMLDFDIRAQLDFLRWIVMQGLVIHEIGVEDIPQIIILSRKYADLPMDFADATLVVTAERTGIKNIISIDRDFDIYRLPGKMQIRNLFGAALAQQEGGR